MPNYGDVALGLGPKWDRNSFANQKAIILTVGHSNGKADAYLKNEPEKEHQFSWCDPRAKDEMEENTLRHYEFVKKGKWDKNPLLWSWDAEDFCVCFGQRLMARPKEFWIEERAARRKAREDERAKAEEREREDAARLGRSRRGLRNG